MSQRNSGYERMPRDEYSTPEWVTAALLPHLPADLQDIWEPACGSGKMVRVLETIKGAQVRRTDIATGTDFLVENLKSQAIITNPPYEYAQPFIEHAIRLTMMDGMVAMLLRTDFDHAKTRQHLFSMSPRFSKKIVLTKRIQWFEDSKGSPSFNHAWFIWDWKHSGAPTLAYGP